MTLSPSALTLDRETGGLILRAITSASGSGYFHVDPGSGTVTSLVTTTTINLAAGHSELLYDPSSGGVIDARRVNFAAQAMRIAPETGATPSETRTIPLAFDPLVVASITGALPGVLANTVGTLGPRGDAVVDVNLNQFGNGLGGVRVWGAAVVLDPASPSRIVYIAGPTLLQLDGVS